MIADTAPLVDHLLLAEQAAGADLHPMIVTGAGTTIASCWGLPSSSVSSWSGLISTALEDAAENDRAKRLYGEGPIRAWVEQCKNAASAEDLLKLCDQTCEIYRRTNLDLSQWIYDRLTLLGNELEVRIKVDAESAPLLSVIRDWQDSFGTVVATTNYDSLLTIADCGDPIELYEAPLAEAADVALADILAGAPNVIHLHGRYDRDLSAVFSGDQYKQLMSVNVEADSFARRLFNATLPIFVGCGAGLADQDLSLLIRERSPGPMEILKRSIVLYKEDDQQIIDMMALEPFDTRCIAIPFGDQHADLVPFLQQVRLDLMRRGFRGRHPRRGSLRAEAWLAQRRANQATHGATVPVPPLKLGRAVRELPIRKFHGTLLRPRVPSYELRAIDPTIELPEAGAALHEDARFDPVRLDALDQLPLALLLGDGGSGKTALTKMIVTRASATSSYLVAAHLRVADYFRSHERFLDGDEGATDLWQFLVDELRSPGPSQASPPPYDDIERALLAAAERGAVLVILDGLDEVSGLSDRAAIVSEALRLHDRLSAATVGNATVRVNRLILTSRFSGYRAAPVLHPAAEHFVLCPLLPSDVGRLHNSFFTDLIRAGAANRDQLQDKRRALRREMAASPLATTSWIDTPLMGVLVAVAFLANGKLPRSREALFDTIVEQGCSFVVDRAVRLSQRFTTRNLRRGLEEAAYRIFLLGVQDSLSRTSLREAFRQIWPKAEEPEIEALVDAATSDQSLLRERGADHFAFIHRGVLEYLCGCRLQGDAEGIALRSQDAAWRQPASFAAGMSLRSDRRDDLTAAIEGSSSIANGYRPLMCLLRGTLYSTRLTREARLAVAQTTIAVASDLAKHVSTIDDHKALRTLLQAVSADRHSLADFETVLAEHFERGPHCEDIRGALLVCEGIASTSTALIAAIDGAAFGMATEQDSIGEHVQRMLLRRHLASRKGRISKPIIDFGATIEISGTSLVGDQLATWRRSLAALAGGIADFGHADLRPVRMTLAKLLAAPDGRRNMLLFTIAERLRDLGLGQQDAVANNRLEAEERAGSGRKFSLQDTVRELRRRPDLMMGFALFLDKIADPTLKDASKPPTFDTRHIYHTPIIAEQLTARIVGGFSVEAVLKHDHFPSRADGERAILAAIVGQEVDPAAGAALEIAMHRVADGATRSLLTVQSTLSARGDIELLDQGFILADAVVDLKMALGMDAQFSIGTSTNRQEYIDRNVRENVARAMTGEGLDAGDDAYHAMVIIDVIDATKRVGALLDLGHSRIVGTGNTAWDLPPLPLPHLHDRHATDLGDAIDNLETCPSAISAFRSDTLRGLLKIKNEEFDAHLDLEAALAQDWGAQSVVDEQARFSAETWEDRGELTIAAARAAKPSLWKARALARLLRLSSADDLAACEDEISHVVEQLADPFEQVLGYETLADRAHPDRGQKYAVLAYNKLIAARPFARPMFRRQVHPSLAEPELCARAFARLSVWLPQRLRDRALSASVGYAAEVPDPWRRTVLLQALAPYARHCRDAQRRWDRAVEKFPSFHRAHCAGESGAVLTHLVDWMLNDAPELAHGEADPIIAYALLRDARRRLGDDLAPWEVLERAEITREGAEKVRRAFDTPTVPKLSTASLISLRAFCDAGLEDVAAFVVQRVSRHPFGTASVVAKVNPDLAMIVRALTRGMDATSAPAIARTLCNGDATLHALALAIVEPPVVGTFKDAADTELAAFTRRRSTVEGLDTLLEFARATLALSSSSGSRTHAVWYLENVLLETAEQADRLIALARGEQGGPARWILERGGVSTPQFLKRLVDTVDTDEKVASIVLLAIAQSLHLSPALGKFLNANGTTAALWRWLRPRPALRRLVAVNNPDQAAQFLKTALRLDPADFDRAYALHNAHPLRRKSDVISALTVWGSTYFAANRPDLDLVNQAAASTVTKDQRTLGALVAYCGWDANASNPEIQRAEGPGFRAQAWPMLASCVELCPVTLQSRMLAAAMFDALPSVARDAPSWVTRRSAFQLMPLEWQGRPAKASLDVIDAALNASDDVWQVQEAALAMVATIRTLDNSALDLLYERAEQGGIKALMAFRMINAIINNDRTSDAMRRHAQSLIERALASGSGDLLIEHGIATANAPPRMRLREVLLQQAFADA